VGQAETDPKKLPRGSGVCVPTPTRLTFAQASFLVVSAFASFPIPEWTRIALTTAIT
jgi:hypothetical protein